MRWLPKILRGNIPVPAVSREEYDRAINIMVGGNLTDDEKTFVERAARRNWTIRIVVDELRERRGMAPVPNDFDWRTLQVKA